MDQTLAKLGNVIRNAIIKVTPPAGRKRPSTKEIYGALKAARPLLTKRFGGPVKCRYAGCPPVTKKGCGGKPLKVLEYLWDFSFSRFDIPGAIEQCGNLRALANMSSCSWWNQSLAPLTRSAGIS